MDTDIGSTQSRSWAERIGERARRARLNRGEALESVARRARLGIGALSEIERGKREARLEGYERLAKALEVPLGLLLGIRSPRTRSRASSSP